MDVKQIENIVSQFDNIGVIHSIKPYGNGHINDTYFIVSEENNIQSKYILQRINDQVFKKPLELIHNVELVLSHFKQLGSPKLFTLRSQENPFVKDSEAKYWRLYNFIPDTLSLEVVEKNEQAYEAANAYGDFVSSLAFLNPLDFYEVIPQFHDLNFRYTQFEENLKLANQDLLTKAQSEIDFAQNKKCISEQMGELIEGKDIPLRITHNDTKLNNVLLDENTYKAISVIDLDTVMPGYVFNDFGDMVRTFTSPVAEDDPNIDKVCVRQDVFESLASGYIEALKSTLTKDEVDSLVLGSKYMVLIIGLRFLTDYLGGSSYFKIHYPEHNLVRAKNQFALLRSIEENELSLIQIIKKYI